MLRCREAPQRSEGESAAGKRGYSLDQSATLSNASLTAAHSLPTLP